MKELNIVELESVNGAGWLKDCLGTVAGKIGNGIWVTTGDVLTVDLPSVGTLNIADLAPSLGRNIGSTVGNTLGGLVEGALGSVPVVGFLFKKVLGN